MSRGPGKIQKRVLLLLQAGIALSLSISPQRQLRVLKGMHKEWKKIDSEVLSRSIQALYQSKLVSFHERGEKVDMVLSKEGEKKVLTYAIDNISVKKPVRWDGKWRIVLFDIPKDEKKAREAFRSHLYRFGFRMLQKSVFVFPYPCDDEIDFLVECYELQRYVRRIVADDIDNGLHLKKIFNV
ncbi:MAG: CRISPR-associated endonuclease Cas2 [Patescibacteria group bacterium]|nr:CRISPR-associated endonuclease Cas2 [Patescibacteria group bacterium]